MLHSVKQPIKGKRITLRHLHAGDAAFIYRLLNTEGWLRFIGNRNILNEDAALKYLQEGPINAYSKFGYGLFCVETNQNADPIGICGLLNRDSLKHPDLGFAFLPDHTGKGFAEEACRLVLENLPASISIVDAITLPENTRSVHLLKKIDFVFVEAITMTNENEVLHVYRRVD
jgi:RimJ/RimL family protein N-acetyltransferase